jgi:hypothetical protein
MSGARGRTAGPGRRRVVAVCALAVGMVLMTACQSWSQFMGDAAHDGNDAGETIIGPSNVTTLHQVFTLAGFNSAQDGVTTSGGTIYATAGPSGLAAYSFGSTGCSGTPKTCQPLWTGVARAADFESQPVVADGRVFQSGDGVSGGDLRAFDANGVTNCSGTPVVCQPLWMAPARSAAGPVVDGNTLLINSHGTLEAYDARGVTNCSGSPVVCQPLWTASVPANWIPTVAGGKVYVATDSGPPEMEVFDEAGVAGCSGSPTVCQPLWTASLPGTTTGSVAVSNGVAYVLTAGGLAAVDANGVTGCAGSPVVCEPIWTAPQVTSSSQGGGTPAVADGYVFVLGDGAIPVIAAFDAAGVQGCSGTPVVCSWLGATPTLSGGTPPDAPVVANGLVWEGPSAYGISELATACTIPACVPVFTLSGGTSQGPTAISIGTVLLDRGSDIDAYQLAVPTS